MLCTLLVEQPGLTGKVELLLATLPSSPAKPAPKPTAPTIDADLFRREAMGIMGASRGRRHRYHDYGETSAVVNELDSLLSRIRSLLDADDGLNALVALEPIMEVMTEQWHDYDDSNGELGQTFDELGALFAEAILRADPTGEERENWQEQLETWRDELAEYGCEEGFATACRAVAEGWREPGEHTSAKDNHADDPLLRMRLNILESRGEYEAFLRLALASNAHDAHVLGLVRLGRLEEAERVTREQIRHPRHVLLIAQALQERGDTPRALQIAEWGVFREDPEPVEVSRQFRYSLAVWLRDLARDSGIGDLACRAASEAFSANCDMDDWLAAHDIAGESWSGMREELLARMAATKNTIFPANRIAVYLHEGLIAEAVREADGERFYSNYDLLRRLMKAAMTSHPDWVIRRSRKEADEIMDAGRANAYDSAAEWLGLTRQAFVHNDRSAEWTALINALIQRHTRKYKLRPLLEKLK